ncbi:MAG: hypothetical protein COB54_01690 [Alphaproteobacteria bacterium]|nr:MAG: hypothetical protein COB54_01690 [Alphaproteobacteria bacterium]
MTNFTKLLMLISTLVLLIGGGVSFYLTYQGYQTVALTNASEQGIAIDGFDAVAFHTEGSAQKGLEHYQVTWAGATWYFSTFDNRQAFSGDPEKYAPQFGGYDSYGMAMNGATHPATPELWTIEDAKLFLFHSGQTRKRWHENSPDNLREANINWTRIKQQIQYKREMEKDTKP